MARKKSDRPIGKLPLVITDEMLRQAGELAGIGLTQVQIASVLGIGESTLRKHKHEDARLYSALEAGRAKAAAIVGRALFHRASDGDVNAIKWYEMTRQNRAPLAPVAPAVESDEDGAPTRFAVVDPHA